MASLREIKALSLVLMSISLLSLKASTAGSGGGGGTVFDVTTFGGVPDGKKDSTQAMIKAWNAACKSPGAVRLVFPPGNFLCGEVVFAGPCTGPITVEVNGNISSSSDLSQFSGGIWIEVTGVDGITITGTGTLDGKGPEVWKFSAKNGGDSMLPNTLQFSKVKNGVMENINVVNSKGFHTKVTDSSDVQVRNMRITAPGDSPNTDGLHISSSTNVNVTDMVIRTGDDCVSIGEGNTNVNVLNVICGPGHGLSVGSLGKRQNEKDVRGVLVKNCTLQGTTNGARIKTFHASPAIVATGIIFEDITMEAVKNPIIIDQHYSSKNIAGESKVALSDIHFRNIKGTTITPEAVTLYCSKAVPCKDVELTNINLTPAAGIKGALTSVCDNVQPAISTMASVDGGSCGGGPAAKPDPAAVEKPDPAAGEKPEGKKEKPKGKKEKSGGGHGGDEKAGANTEPAEM